LLGHGTHSVTYKAKDPSGNESVAVIHDSSYQSRNEHERLWELRKRLGEDIPHIVQIQGWFGDNLGPRGVVLGMCDITLEKWIQETYIDPDIYPHETSAWNIIFQIASGLTLLHVGPQPPPEDAPGWIPIPHGDVHESNVVVNHAADGLFPTFKLANFTNYPRPHNPSMFERFIIDIRGLGLIMARLVADRSDADYGFPPPEYSLELRSLIESLNPDKGGPHPPAAVSIVLKAKHKVRSAMLWERLDDGEKERWTKLARIFGLELDRSGELIVG
jgi:hypothetical protein